LKWLFSYKSAKLMQNHYHLSFLSVDWKLNFLKFHFKKASIYRKNQMLKLPVCKGRKGSQTKFLWVQNPTDNQRYLQGWQTYPATLVFKKKKKKRLWSFSWQKAQDRWLRDVLTPKKANASSGRL
jgi:hypothetical protein